MKTKIKELAVCQVCERIVNECANCGKKLNSTLICINSCFFKEHFCSEKCAMEGLINFAKLRTYNAVKICKSCGEKVTVCDYCGKRIKNKVVHIEFRHYCSHECYAKSEIRR